MKIIVGIENGRPKFVKETAIGVYLADNIQVASKYDGVGICEDVLDYCRTEYPDMQFTVETVPAKIFGSNPEGVVR